MTNKSFQAILQEKCQQSVTKQVPTAPPSIAEASFSHPTHPFLRTTGDQIQKEEPKNDAKH